jgi:uncharacterized protein involved in outer membrane biogenesis
MASTTESTAVSAQGRRWLRPLAFVVVGLAALVLVTWLAVPPIVRAQLEARLTEALGRTTTVESVKFNPFNLRLSVFKLAIADRAGPQPLLAIDALDADFSAASFWHRAPVLDALTFVRPRVSLARDRDGRYNVQDLIDAALAAKGETQRFSLNNIAIDDGGIVFADGVTGRKHELAALNIGIPFLSSLPYQTTILVTPRAEGTFNGTHFALSGTSVPFAEHREATLDIDLDALPLPPYVAYLPTKLRFELASGALTTKLKLVFVEAVSGGRHLELRGDARIDGLSMKRRDGTPLAAVERIAVGLDRIDVFGHDARIDTIAFDAPVVDLKRLADGTLEWARLLPDSAPSAAPPPGTPRETPWNFRAGKLGVTRGAVALVDETSTFRSTLVDITLDATNVSTKPGDKAHVKLDLVSSDRIATFAGEADVEPSVPAASGRFQLARFSLGLLFPFYKSALAVDVQKGSLDYASAFALDAAGNLRLADGEATISDLRLAVQGNKEPMSQVPRMSLRQVDVDVHGRKVALGELQSSGAVLRMARDADGSFEMTRLVKAAESGKPADDATWTLLTRKLSLDRVALDVEDRVPQPPFKLALRELALTATDVSSAAGATSRLTLRAKLGKQGHVAFTGPLTRSPFRMNGDLDVSGFSLTSLKQYIEPQVNVAVTDGTLQAKGRLSLDVPEAAGVRASWKGDVAIADFAALDKPTSSALARWKSLSLAGVDMTVDPFRASVGRIDLDDFYARVIVYSDATLNVTRLLTPGASAEPAPGAKPATAAEAAPAREALPISIGHIELSRGNVNFSDFYIKPNYSANLTDVAGSVGAMSAEQAGELSLAAHVERTAPVEVHGRLHPFAKELSLDIAAKASDIDLPPLSSYSAKYAGYGIERGQLTFDVHYQVENRKLTAENRLVLDQLKFGPRVESPTATKLPVLLAVALLRNSRGVIDIKLPISGSLDDPKFSVGGIIIQVIVNLITKAVTAPFALLSAAFGGGEELSTLAFAPGSAALPAEAQKRVDILGKALADRPALKLDIAGHADPSVDGDALRQGALTRAMRTEKMKSLAAAGTAPASVDQVAIEPDERVRWLTAAYRESSIPDRPRNMIGMLKDVPPAEMEAMFIANAKVDDEALRSLANDRARAVKEALVAKGIADDRVFLIAPRTGGTAGGNPGNNATGTPVAATPTRVDLALR